MVSKFGFTQLVPRPLTPREREEQRQRDIARRFEKAKHKIAAILRDYNAARNEDLSVDPHTYFEGGELVIPQRDGESVHLAQILHEQTGIDVRLTRRASGYLAGYGTANRPTFVVETVAVFTKERGRDPSADGGLAGAVGTPAPTRPAPHAEDRLIEPDVSRREPISATAESN